MKIAIIGAGAAGLAAAWDCVRAGHEVVIYEAGEEVGGLAAGFKAEGWDWTLEKFYHHWFATDEDILGLLAEMGHRDKVIFKEPVTSVWHPAGSFALDKPVLPVSILARAVNVLTMPGLSIIAKLRFGLVSFLLTLYGNGISLEKHTADAWLRRWVGDAAYEMLWKPMLIGKFGARYDSVNMAWMWARLYKRTAALGTYRGGFQAALEDIARSVQAAGAVLHLETRVQRVAPAEAGGGLVLDAAHDVGGRFDKALATVGPGLLLRLAPDLPTDYAAQVDALESMGAVVLIVALEQQLMSDGTYWLNLPAKSPDKAENPFPFLALVEHTNYVSPEHFGGERLVYMGDYLPRDHAYFAMSEDELLDLFLPALAKVNPAFRRDWVRRHWLFRVPYAQPVPLVNHAQHIPDIRTPIDGLYWASMSQVYPWDRGTNYAVEIGRRAAGMMLEA